MIASPRAVARVLAFLADRDHADDTELRRATEVPAWVLRGALIRVQRDGLVTAWQTGGTPHRMYALTEFGRTRVGAVREPTPERL